jgi:hypothetical protein
LHAHLLFTVTLMVLGLATETSRARLLKQYHQRQRELPRVIRQVETPLPLAGPVRVDTKPTGNRRPASSAPASHSRPAPLAAKNKTGETIVKQLRYVLVLLALGFVLAPAVRARQFNRKAYNQLVDANSPDTIPPGTRITVRNWTQYKRFMPIWLQVDSAANYIFISATRRST